MIQLSRIVFCLLLSSGVAFGQTSAVSQTGPAKARTSPQKSNPPATAAAPKTAEKSDDEVIPPDRPGAPFPSVVARVNGRQILGRDLELRIQSELAPIGNPEWRNLKEDYQQDLIAQSLGALVAAELIYQKAVSVGMKATDAEVQDEFGKTAKSFASDAEMNIALANRGMDRSILTRELGRSLTVAKYVNENIAKKISVSPAEINEYYSTHKQEFNHPELIHTSHILIMVGQNSTPEQDKLALQRVEMILARARKGEDFARLAKEYSMDPTASNGGDVGLTPKGALTPEYEDAAFALPVGGISGVVRTQQGYHIIKVTEKRKAGTADLEEVRPALSDYLKTQRVDQELGKVVGELSKAAKLEVLLRVKGPLIFSGATASSPRR